MGYWNYTCMLSNLPIVFGDEVIAYLIKENPKFTPINGTCYPFDYAKPCSYGIRAKYNDYGGIEGLDSLSINFIERSFNQSLDSVLDSIQDEELVFKGSRVGLVMIHKAIHDDVVKSFSCSKQDFINTKNRIAASIKSDTMMFLNIDDFYYGEVSCKDYKDLSFLYNDQDEFISELCARVIELHSLTAALSSLRKFWIGQSGRGSQDEGYISHLKFIESMRSFIFSKLANGENGPTELYKRILNGEY